MLGYQNIVLLAKLHKSITLMKLHKPSKAIARYSALALDRLTTLCLWLFQEIFSPFDKQYTVVEYRTLVILPNLHHIVF